jgi:hypothetical protein
MADNIVPDTIEASRVAQEFNYKTGKPSLDPRAVTSVAIKLRILGSRDCCLHRTQITASSACKKTMREFVLRIQLTSSISVAIGRNRIKADMLRNARCSTHRR